MVIRYKNIEKIKNIKVLKVYNLSQEVEGRLKIIYEEDQTKKVLSIISGCHFGPMYEGCWFDIELEEYKEFDKRFDTSKFSDIELIEKINIYTKSIDNGAHTDLEIVYKNEKDETHTYLFHSTYHEEEVHEIYLFKDKKSTYKLKKANP